MEITARVRELHAEFPGILFVKALRDELGLSLVEAKEIMIRLGCDESWTIADYQEKVILPILEEDEEIESL